jgi:ferric-dicitrate binding protein FerR (iron transport regulator)
MSENKEHLILQYLQGKIEPAEKQAFESWRNESEENRRMVDELQRIWQLTNSNEITTDFQSEEEWRKLNSLLDRQETPVRRLDRSVMHWSKIAAAILLVILSSFILYLTFFKADQVVLQTAGNILHNVLPDGSEVWLNTESRLTYDEDFDENRLVKLEGEAFFNVKRNPEKPFVIRSEDAQVGVLGTSFNVKAYKNEIQTEVFVVTGKVRLGINDQEKYIILTPGTTGILTKKGHRLITEPQGDANILAWKNKRLVFKKTPLGTVVRILRSYFKRDIRVKNEALLSCRFTGSFNDPTLEEVIEILHLALDLGVDRQQETYLLDGVGCKED